MEMSNVCPTIIAALPAIAVSIISIIVNCIQWSKEKKRTKNAAICDALQKKLQCFYYPYLLLEKENTELYKMFAIKEKDKDKSFKTLVYLLNGQKDTFSENDKNILSIIIENDIKLRTLINENGQYIDSDSLRKDLSDMAVHYQLIELAYDGSISEVNGSNVYSKHVYPHDIQTKIEAEKKRIEEEIKELQPGGKKE